MTTHDLEIMQPEYGAGTTHNWDKDKYGIRGIGIATYRFNERDSLKIKVGRTTYGISYTKVKDFMKEYPKSTYLAKGVRLLVIPISIMRVIKEDPYVPLYKQPEESKQPTLF